MDRRYRAVLVFFKERAYLLDQTVSDLASETTSPGRSQSSVHSPEVDAAELPALARLIKRPLTEEQLGRLVESGVEQLRLPQSLL
jgi:hypothetical protein